jgi:hypothetical protein
MVVEIFFGMIMAGPFTSPTWAIYKSFEMEEIAGINEGSKDSDKEDNSKETARVIFSCFSVCFT